MREHVVQALFVIDDFLRQLDGAVVSRFFAEVSWVGPRAQAEGLPAPVCAAGGCLEGFGPDELYAARLVRERGNAGAGYCAIEFGEEGSGQVVFLFGEGFALGANLRYSGRFGDALLCRAAAGLFTWGGGDRGEGGIAVAEEVLVLLVERLKPLLLFRRK